MTVAAEPTTFRRRLAELLSEARERTLLIVSPLTRDDVSRQHDPLMSPIIWDLGHIAHFEALWLTRNLEGPIEFSEMPGIFNPFEHPRRTRGDLSLPGLEEWNAMQRAIRADVLEKLEGISFSRDGELLHEGYVYHMVLQHEYQHGETILQTLQLKLGEPYTPAERRSLPDGQPERWIGREVEIPDIEAEIGTDDRSCAYDNERPRYRATVRAFAIDAAPVSNGEFVTFISDGGYARRELWTDAGWGWLQEAGVVAPKHWEQRGGEWWTRTMDVVRRIPEDHPVVHVCCHEAEAYARWAGKRLPTEMEWEIAAGYDPATGSVRPYPWGREAASASLANVDQLGFGTAAIGGYERNVSPLGCYGMIGDVWEWTASDFHGYPGFEPFPYPEYSEAFFGTEYRVLRGGSWATRPGAIRNSFRNWDYPIRRQIFSGFRCARDV